MSEEETSHLKAEIARLNKIINVLLEQIDTIKAGYSHLQQHMGINNPVNSFLRNTSRQEKTDFLTEGNTLRQEGMNEAIHSPSAQHMGGDEANHSPYTQDVGTEKSNHSALLQDMGVNEANSSHVSSTMEANDAIHPTSSATMPSNSVSGVEPLQTSVSQQQNPLLPAQITPSSALLSSIAAQLHAAGFTRVKGGTREMAAQLLIHFHNGGAADYAALQQLTGYSTGGLGKLLINIRKRGFIQRASHGKYVVTEKGKQVLAQALGG